MNKLIWISTFIVFTFLLGCNKIDKKLTETTWVAKSYKVASSSSNEQAPATYTLLFKEKEINLSLDVNQCGGDYSIGNNNKINFSSLYCTEACCDSDFAIAIVSLLPKMKTYVINKYKLTLKGEGEIEFLAK